MSEQSVTGLAELQQFLDQLPAKLEKNVLRGAMRAGAKVQLERARQLVPVGPPGTENARIYGGYAGALRDSLRISTTVRGSTVKATVKAGGKTRGGADVYYAHMVEFGTAAHFIKPKNRKSLFFAGLAREVINHPGAKKHPFMRPALDATVQAAVQAVGAYIRKRLTKEGIEVPSES